MSRTRKTLIGIFLLVLAGIAPWIVLAATQTMNGLASGGCPCGTGWTTVACWNNAAGPVPTTGDDVVIDGGQTPSDTNYNLGGGVQLRSITLNRIGACTGNVNISGGPIVLQSGGFITDGFCNQGTNGFPGVSLNGPATFTHDACASGSNSSTTSINGALTGTGPLTLVNNLGDDNLRLTVASTYTGSTMVNGTGRVRFDVNGAVATGSALTVNGSALFQASSTIGSLAGGGNVFMNGSNALTAGGDNTSTTFSGMYQNSGGAAALTKTGTGTLTLSGANTYTGATTVNAGALRVNGSTAAGSAVTVANGGTLGGTGTVGAVTVNSGGTLAPGNSPGIINTGNLTLSSSSTLAIELNGTTAGPQYDQVNVTGTVDLGGATLNVSLGFTPSGGQTFTIINNDSIEGVVNTFNGLPEGGTFSAGARPFQITYAGGTNNNDVVLTVLKLNQTITFNALAPKTFGDPDFMVSATASSGLPVSFSASGQCTVTSPSPGTVHLTGAGSCTITASQGGDVNYNPAPNVAQSFSIAKANQTITFGAIPPKTFGDPDFNVNATASSGLPVSLSASGNCTVTSPSPGTVHLTGAGSCTITASQGGDANYNPAASVPQSFTIAKAATTTAVSATPNPSSSGQSVTFTATVTSGAGTPTGTVQFKDGGTNLGSPQALNGSGVATFSTTALTPGMHTITADYSGDVNFLTSSGTLAGGQTVSASADLAVTKSGPATITAGNNITYNISVTNNGPSDAQSVTLSDTLPAGTTFVSEAQNTGPAFNCTNPAVGASGSVNCTIGTLASGSSATFTLIYKVGANVANGTTLTNTASASSTTSDPTPGNNSQSSSATVSASADLSVTKSGPATITAGNNITYNISVTNNGPSDAQSVTLSDTLPAGTTFVSEAQNTGPAFNCTNPAVGASGSVNCTIATLASGSSATFTLVLKVGANVVNNTTLINTASASSTTSDPTPGNNSASTPATVIGINQAPVNHVPGSQTATLNGTLVFSAANGNLIFISDVDAGGDPVQVTLGATDGTLTLSTTSGLSFTVGDGTNDPLMTFTGSIANINAALNGMSNLAFGSGVIEITTNDLGHNGVGGPLSRTDTIAVTVIDNLAPVLLTIQGSDRAIAFESVTFVIDPFSLVGNPNFTADFRTRIILFALHAQLRPGEDASAVTAEADISGTVVPLTVESVTTVPGFDWLTQLVVKLPDRFSTGGGGPHDAKIRIRLRGAFSNQAVITVVPAPAP